MEDPVYVLMDPLMYIWSESIGSYFDDFWLFWEQEIRVVDITTLIMDCRLAAAEHTNFN